MVQFFAEARVAHVAFTARREAPLQEVKAKTETAFPKTKVSVHVGDVVDAGHLRSMAKSVGKWDVLITNERPHSSIS